MSTKRLWLAGKWKWVVPVIIIALVFPAGLYLVSNREKEEIDEAKRIELGGTYISLSEGITHYELIGPPKGSVVVLVHGGSVPMWGWDSQVASLAAAGLRVLRYDMYARGYSDRPNVEYNRALYREQLLELLNALGLIEPVDLVGLSFGGAIAADFTANHPGRVRHLVLCAPMVAFAETGQNATYQKLLRMPAIGDFLLRTVVMQKYIERASYLFEPSEKSNHYNKLFREQFKYKGGERAVLSMFRGDALGDYRDSYGAIGKQDRKVMLIWGTADSDISRSMIDEVREAIPHICFHSLEGVGHGLNFEASKELNELIIDFLNNTR